MTARWLLDQYPDPSEEEIREALSGQLCRCTGYENIVRVDPMGRRARAEQRRERHVDRASVGCLARRTPGSCAAAGRSSTTCAARHAARRRAAQPATPTRGSSPSTPPPPRRTRRSAPCSPARDLAERGLAWMPTLSHDVQAVLATDKVRFQGQEVAFVVAEDRYSARDALALIDVEYEPLDRRRRRPARARRGRRRVIRDDLAASGQPRLRLGGRRRGGHRRGVRRRRDVVVAQDLLYPRVHPAPLETCGIVADLDAGHRQAHRVGDEPRPRTRTGCCSRDGHRASRSTGSGSCRPTSAAGSATRCRSTRRTCARWSARWSPARR